jgi:Flp pilus assembly protein TadD
MELTSLENNEKLVAQALEALAARQTQTALALLERSLKLHDNPSLYSSLGYCIAKERGQVKKGCDLCNESLDLEPENPLHYLNLAKIHLMTGHKSEALDVLREGMATGGSLEIVALLGEIGPRKPPVLSFLPRDHALNKWLGLILHRLGLR